MAELSVLRDVVDRLRPKLTQRWPIAAQKAALAYIHRTSVEQAVDDLRVSRTRLKFWVNFGIMQSDGFLSLDQEVLNREQRTLTLWIREYLTDRHPDHHLCIGPQGYGPILRKAVVVLCLSCKSDVSKASRLSSISIGSIRLWLGTYDTINVAEFYDLHIREHEERFKEDPEESVEDTTNEENMTDTTDTTDTKTRRRKRLTESSSWWSTRRMTTTTTSTAYSGL